MGLIQPGGVAEPEIEIPEQVARLYKLWRPTPLFRAHRLERALETPAHIYYKYEGVSPAGSHKPNTAVPQAYENAQAGIKSWRPRPAPGQWGSSLAFACSLFGLECEVFMVGSSYDQKPYRRSMMETWGASVHRSPVRPTQAGPLAGRAPHGLARHRDLGGRRGRGAGRDANYSLGSVLNHVLLHQTVIGQEAIAQMDMAGEAPDVVIGCVGGGSNFAGLAFPFLRAMLRERSQTRFVAAEPAACPTLTRGVYPYDFGDTVGLTPLMPMYTLGHDFVPPPCTPAACATTATRRCSAAWSGRLVEARADRQNETFEAARAASRAAKGSSRRPRRRTRSGRAFEEAEAAQRGRRAARDPLQPLGPRPLRPRGLRRVPVGHARGPGVLGSRHGVGARAAAGGAGAGLTIVSENVERLRRGYAAWNRRDWEELFSMIDPEMEWMPLDGTLLGRPVPRSRRDQELPRHPHGRLGRVSHRARGLQGAGRPGARSRPRAHPMPGRAASSWTRAGPTCGRLVRGSPCGWRCSATAARCWRDSAPRGLTI